MGNKCLQFVSLLCTVVSLGFAISNLVIMNQSFPGTSCSMPSGLTLNNFFLAEGIVSLSSLGACVLMVMAFGCAALCFWCCRSGDGDIPAAAMMACVFVINLVISGCFLVVKFVLLVFGAILVGNYCSGLGWITTYAWCFMSIDFAAAVLYTAFVVRDVKKKKSGTATA